MSPHASSKTTFKKQNFKHESFKQSASVNEVESVESNENYLGTQGSAHSGGFAGNHQTINSDEPVYHSTSVSDIEQLKKLKKSRQELLRLREVSERCFQCIENRDKQGLMRYLD